MASGYFVATASAAGVLSQIGSAPYSVTKHGAVAFAEWLSITYGERGIGVSCLCPMGVNTNMLNTGLGLSDDAAPGEGRQGARVVAAAGDILEPEDVADIVLRGDRRGALPDPAPPRGARVHAPQDLGLRPLDPGHAAPSGSRQLSGQRLPLLEIFLLAAASMLWPLLLVVVVIALSTTQPARILGWFWAGGMLTTVAVGSVLVFVLQDSPLMHAHNKLPSAPEISIVVGALALVAAFALTRVRRRRGPRTRTV